MTVFRQESSLQNGQISTRMVGNSQSSSLPARHDEMNNSVSRPNNHFVKSDTNSVSQENLSQQSQLIAEKANEFDFSGQIRSLALFIRFGEEITNKWSAKEFHKFGFHSVFKTFTANDHVKAYEFVFDSAVNCWANIWKIIIIVTSTLEVPINKICDFVNKIRNVFDKLTLDVVVIRPMSQQNFKISKWKIVKATLSFIVIYKKDEIKKSFENLLFEICKMNNVQQSIKETSICFYSKCDPYYEFTNFFPAPVIIDEIKWPTTENYFQASKFECDSIRNKIQEARSARKAFNISRHNDYLKRHDWEHNIPDTYKPFKDNVMQTALMAKFDQHIRLKYLLLSTGNASLFEHTKNDIYWGDGGDCRKGLNKLGKMLEEVRKFYMLEEIQKTASKYEKNDEKWVVDELRELNQFE